MCIRDRCDGKVAGMDIDAARRQVQRQFEGLLAKYPDRTWGHPALDTLFPPTYPPGLMESDMESA